MLFVLMLSFLTRFFLPPPFVQEALQGVVHRHRNHAWVELTVDGRLTRTFTTRVVCRDTGVGSPSLDLQIPQASIHLNPFRQNSGGGFAPASLDSKGMLRLPDGTVFYTWNDSPSFRRVRDIESPSQVFQEQPVYPPGISFRVSDVRQAAVRATVRCARWELTRWDPYLSKIRARE